ncbi:hypothetical protein Aspvir_000543 [Aspergillus viridinutans]|uniref:NADH-ubiquinone reductase complex 1 MLRQ subunit n=3 Tax=Aspergillus subgen. Fumigati TaxID=2720872 RepID=A0A9P3BSJ6_ASPVI|nr:uncharacterized protein Aspvir_000543 [Aspergillus viridinutans]GIJ98426.1 hypothetical protein Aspvir_000543 [Aspergillus viridinutans]
MLLAPFETSRPELPSPLPVFSSHHHLHYSFHQASLSAIAMFPTRALRMQASRPFAFPTPKENQSAHTISQRLRTLKRVPPELIPLGIVLGVAVGAAIYSSTRKLMTDKTLRLYRNKPEDREH